jgi:hypothetical protein
MKVVDDSRTGKGAPDEPRVRLPLVVCKFLRTKKAFGSPEDGAPDWREGRSTTAVYWCLRSMETWGPDEQVTHAHECREGRACFEAPYEPNA